MSFQAFAQALKWSAAGAFVLATLLSGLYTAKFIAPRTTYLATAVVILGWGLTEVTAARRPRWKIIGGKEVKLRGLGREPRWGFTGALLLLWAPRLWSLVPLAAPEDTTVRLSDGTPAAQAALTDGIRSLASYDLLSAEDHFCRAVQADPTFLRARLNLARVWRDRGYDGAAALQAQRLLDMANKLGAAPDEVKLHEAFRAETRGDWTEATRKYRELWDANGIQSFDLVALVQALNLAGQNGLVLETVDAIRSRQLVESVHLAPLDEVRLQIERAIALMKSGSGDQLAAAQQAERTALEANRWARDVDNTYLLARAELVQCDALTRMSRSESDAVCKSALARFQTVRGSADTGKVYQLLGQTAADPEEGLSYYRQALDIYKTFGFQRGIADVMVNIALLLDEAGDENKAGLVCGQALAVAVQIGSLNLPEIRLNCAYYAMILDDDFRGARKEAEAIIGLTREQGNKRLEASALHNAAYAAHAEAKNAANAAQAEGSYRYAAQSYRDAIAVSSELQDASLEAHETILLYAWVLADLGNNAESRRQFERAVRTYPLSQRSRIVADVVCWDRPNLGSGTAEWLRMLERFSGFTTAQCDSAADGQDVAPLTLDPSLWARVDVEEPDC